MVVLLDCHNHKNLNKTGYHTIRNVITMKFWLVLSVFLGELKQQIQWLACLLQAASLALSYSIPTT